MGILDEVTNMQNQGVSERDISKNLQERGFSPKAIEDAFNQVKIKKAVSAEPSQGDAMEPSIMNGNQGYSESSAQSSSPLYTPKTQEIGHEQEAFYSPQPMQAPQQGEYDYSQQQTPMYQEYDQGEYPMDQGAYDEQAGGTGGVYDTDTIIEIAEQVFSEKIKNEQKQIESLIEFASLAETKIKDDHERIKRMESMMDKLQIAILEKIGSYGKNLESVKNEMGMMQESFEKMVPSLHKENSGKKRTSSKTKK